MKILKHLEDELAKIDTTKLASSPTNQSVTPTEILAILASLKGALIAVLNFIKIFTSDSADIKIDALIAWLNALP